MNKNDVETLCNLPIRNHSSEVSKYFMIGLVYQKRTITFAHRIFDSLQSVGIPLKFFSYHCVNSDVLIWENWGIFFYADISQYISNLYPIKDRPTVSKRTSFTCSLWNFAECGNRKALRLKAQGVYSC